MVTVELGLAHYVKDNGNIVTTDASKTGLLNNIQAETVGWRIETANILK